MCLTAKDCQSEACLSRAPLELPSLTIDTRQLIVCSCISFKVYVPTLAKNVEDYPVSIYELCEDG